MTLGGDEGSEIAVVQHVHFCLATMYSRLYMLADEPYSCRARSSRFVVFTKSDDDGGDGAGYQSDAAVFPTAEDSLAA